MNSDKLELTKVGEEEAFPTVDPKTFPSYPAYCYMLECRDGSLYTGWTNDPTKRLRAHQSGKGGHYTAARLPVRLVYLEGHETRREAMSREVKIKQLSRSEKCQLIRTTQENNMA